MELQEAIHILKQHNKWRVGADVAMIHSKDLTEAINIIVENYECRKNVKNET